ncbi:hypothetical protein M2T82_00980 [Elizabethkingia ursingii]|uniref:hypothetical protein n=1 Tax=Elizabethkingia TaxID=308865 RepID=UPI000D312008|nr:MULTISPECIES: hypothetical protein [Elizabethkingia]MCL1666626.1 hypothetical protein [Elizabethkingia ursingii]PUB33721.1 hypothetical protein C8J95_103321 [Elizabethkingia sp. YR214]
MQSNIHKTKTVVYISIMFFFILSCTKKTDLENQITITIKSINSGTKQSRINMFDTIEVRKKENGYLTKTFEKVGEYRTDSTGSIKIKIDRTKEYRFILKGIGIYGSSNFTSAFTKENLKNGEEVNIEAVSVEKK